MRVITRAINLQTKEIISSERELEPIITHYSDRVEYIHPVTKKLHREDGPAREWFDGDKEWWVNGRRHRLYGPAVEQFNGDNCWWINGKLHRLDGPAVDRLNKYKSWWINGELHRLDGPAVEHTDGRKQWWIKGVRYSEEEWLVEVERVGRN